MSFRVNSIIYYEHQPNDFVVEHSHHCFECVYYLDGSGTISVEKETYFYNGPTLTVVPPGLLHDEKTDTKTRLFIVLFDIEESNIFNSFSLFKIDEETNKKIKAIFEEMIEEEKSKKPHYQGVISALFSSVIYKVARQLSAKKVSSNKEMVERTKTYIKENYRQNIDFEAIAFNIGYSFDRFRHIFKEETGVSIHQYLLNCRLYAAKQLLLMPNITVKEVAKSCGFDSAIHFNNFFKAKMNISPYQFRKASLQPIDEGVFVIDGATKKQMIIDTDIGGDCDDAGALALANIFHNSGKIEVLGMTYTTSSVYGPAVIDSINKFYGNKFEIGQTARNNFCDVKSKFLKEIATKFDNDYFDPKTKTIIKAESAVDLLRRKLSEANNESVSLVCIGQLNNMSDLLDSKPDCYSPLDGVSLVREKVKEFIIMGGLFPKDDKPILFENYEYKAEYNIVSALDCSRNFIKKCPTKVFFVDFLCGNKVFTGQSLFNQNNEKNPVTIAYKLFQNKPRYSWDPLTIWYATFGKCNFFKLSKEGEISIDENGITTHNPEVKKGHYYLMIDNSVDYIAKKIDSTFTKEE